MAIGMTSVKHVKVPVTDLQRSVTWYSQLMDLELQHEFMEDGQVRGAALRSPEANFSFALRLREDCASQPVLTGFDAYALHMSSRDDLVALHKRCESLGFDCTEVQDRGPHEAVVDVPDPDGTVLRFYWATNDALQQPFVRYVFDGEGPPRFEHEPSLDIDRVSGR